MKIFIPVSAILLSASAVAVAQAPVGGVSVGGFRMEHSGKYMSVEMQLGLDGLHVPSNRAVLLTPWLVNGSDSLQLPSVGVYGRTRYYQYVRQGGSMLTGKDEQSYKSSERPDALNYSQLLPYEEWMNGADLTIRRSEYGCCHKLLATQSGAIGSFTEQVAFFPELVYVRPAAEMVKSRSLEGSAFIDFPVDRTEIHYDYRRNASELGKIRATIDSVRGDSDVTITQVWLKGFASPESPYAHNKELAIGRTESLRQYILQLYHFSPSVIATDYEAEDWDGLRRYVEQSNISHKEELLAIINSDLEPDAREWKLKSGYPDEYRFLLHNCYPSLRHTDYRIAYNIRGYSDVDEIKRIMAEQPQKLSLNEFYLVAQQYEPGTDEFTEVYETAVRMFPTDATANLNAANAAIRRDDFAAAARYLAKAGNSPEAIYARGALAIRQGDYDTARRYLGEAKSLGVEQAAVTLEELNKKHKY